MHFQFLLVIGALVPNTLGNVLNVNIYTGAESSDVDEGHEQEVLASANAAPPRWKKRDDLHLVPLAPGAKTGLLDTEVEEGLSFALGPRFVNVFLEAAGEPDANDSSVAASCNPLKCAGTMIKAAPCVLAAVNCKCLAPLKSCPGVSQSSFCSCVDCLPAPLPALIGKLGFCSGSVEGLSTIASDAPSEYPEYVAFSTRDANLLAYRGDLPKTTLTEAKEVNAAGFCPGAPCGDCSCCLGLCVLGQCVGACI